MERKDLFGNKVEEKKERTKRSQSSIKLMDNVQMTIRFNNKDTKSYVNIMADLLGISANEFINRLVEQGIEDFKAKMKSSII